MKAIPLGKDGLPVPLKQAAHLEMSIPQSDYPRLVVPIGPTWNRSLRTPSFKQAWARKGETLAIINGKVKLNDGCEQELADLTPAELAFETEQCFVSTVQLALQSRLNITQDSRWSGPGTYFYWRRYVDTKSWHISIVKKFDYE